MKPLKRMRFFLLLALVAMLSGISSYSQIDNKILWKEDSLKKWFPIIAVIPNGNILCFRQNSELYELNGINGKLKKYFGILDNGMIINCIPSKDGKYFLTDGDATRVIDYQKGESIFGIGGQYTNSGALYPDSKRVVGNCARKNADSSDMFIYNLETNQYEKRISCYEIHTADAMAISDDGNLLAIAGFFFSDYGTSHQKTSGRVIIFDAHTLVPIKTLPDSAGNSYCLRFSPDSKTLAYINYNRLFLWNADSFNLVKQYNNLNRPISGICNYCFINNSTIAMTSADYNDSAWFEIDDFKEDKVLYRTNEFGSIGSQCAYNPINNSLVLTNTKNGLVHYALDLSKLLTSIPVESQQQILNVYYNSQTLFIENIFKNSSVITVKIVNLQGQIINQYQIEPVVYNDTIQIPLSLPAGVYFIVADYGTGRAIKKFVKE